MLIINIYITLRKLYRVHYKKQMMCISRSTFPLQYRNTITSFANIQVGSKITDDVNDGNCIEKRMCVMSYFCRFPSALVLAILVMC